MQDSLQEYAKEHTESLEALRLHLSTQLYDEMQELDLDGFKAVVAATALNVSTPLREIAAIDLCEELLTEVPTHTLSEDLQNHRIGLFNDLPGGPSFKCTDLVNCTCDDIDDWEQAFTQCHDLQACKHMSYEPLLMWDDNRELPQPWCAEFFRLLMLHPLQTLRERLQRQRRSQDNAKYVDVTICFLRLKKMAGPLHG